MPGSPVGEPVGQPAGGSIATRPQEPARKQAWGPNRDKVSYVIVEVPGAIFRLHRAGATGCWMGKRRAFGNARELTVALQPHEYTHVCKLCWPNQDASLCLLCLRSR